MAKFEIFSGIIRNVLVDGDGITITMEGSRDGQEISWQVHVIDADAVHLGLDQAAALVLETELSEKSVEDDLDKFFRFLLDTLFQSEKLNKVATNKYTNEYDGAQASRSEHMIYITRQIRVLWAYVNMYLR